MNPSIELRAGTGGHQPRTIRFMVDCIPPKATHQAGLRILRRRDGTQFVGKFAGSRAKQAQNEMTVLLLPHRPTWPLEGPLKMAVTWIYPWRKSETEKNKKQLILACDTRPDIDNLFKMLGDVMTRLGFYRDDAQITELVFCKYWSQKPGILIQIKEMEQL